MIVSLLLVGAGCAHRTYTGASYSGTSYSGNGDTGYYYEHYEPSTTKGAGAQALRNDSAVVSEPTTYAVITPDAASTTQQGAGARALIGQADYIEIVQPQVEVTTQSRETFVGGSTDSTGSSISGSSSLSRDDANFLREAIQSGVAEVRLGELAQQRAQDPSLKSFGEMLVADHKKANEELRRLAEQKQLSIPMEISSKDQAMLDRLSSLEGARFDRVWERDTVDAHEKAIKAFKHAADNSKDPDIRDFAQKTLPTLEQHLREAKQLKSSDSKSST
jgi:putative membrane protein